MTLGFSSIRAESIRTRIEVNTVADVFLMESYIAPENPVMGTKTYTFRELLREALRHNTSMWKDDELNLSAVARLYDKKGYPVSQASLHRLCNSNQDPGERVINATSHVLGIPKNLIRGEPMSSDMDKLLTRYRLSTLLLAEKLESLPRNLYESIAMQVDALVEQQELLQQGQGEKIVSIDKNRR